MGHAIQLEWSFLQYACPIMSCPCCVPGTAGMKGKRLNPFFPFPLAKLGTIWRSAKLGQAPRGSQALRALLQEVVVTGILTLDPDHLARDRAQKYRLDLFCGLAFWP